MDAVGDGVQPRGVIVTVGRLAARVAAREGTVVGPAEEGVVIVHLPRR